MFFIIPLGFLLFSSVDDISVSMFMSGIFSLIGSFLVCFLWRLLINLYQFNLMFFLLLVYEKKAKIYIK